LSKQTDAGNGMAWHGMESPVLLKKMLRESEMEKEDDERRLQLRMTALFRVSFAILALTIDRVCTPSYLSRALPHLYSHVFAWLTTAQHPITLQLLNDFLF